MKEEFLNMIDNNQGIIHKITSIYGSDKEDRKDLFQDIVLQLWKSYPSFEHRSSVSTWMYRVALNTALLRNRKRQTWLPLTDAASVQDSRQPDVDKNDQLISLYMAINQLGPLDKAIAFLFLEKNNYQEIADVLGMNKNTIGVRLNRIKVKLKKVLEYERQ